MASSKYHVPNLERALSIIELLAEHPEGLSISEITDYLEYPRNSIFRITSTLLDNDYLIRDEETKVFQLSLKLLTLGHAAISEQNLVDKSLHVMRHLRDIYKETVPLGILSDTEGITIEEVQGTHPFRFVLEPGKRFHLHTSAPGKAMVAYLPDNEREELLDKIDYIQFNERTITNKEDYRRVLEAVREKGYSTDCVEETEGMNCVGAPIFNRKGYPVAAIWITGPASRLKKSDFDKIGKDVRKHADKISAELGYRNDLTLQNPAKAKIAS